jgi:hypothetical protein
MKTSSLRCLLLLMGMAIPAAGAEEALPEQRVSKAKYEKAWDLFFLADAHLALGEYREGAEAAKSAFRMLRDIRMLNLVALIHEDWGAHVSDPQEASRLKQQAVFFYERTQLILPIVARGAAFSWVRRTLEQRLPPLKEALAEEKEDAEEISPSSEHTVADLEAELARARDELAKKSDELTKERATRAALEQAIRALAAQKPQGPVSEAPAIPVSAPYAAARFRE